MFNLLMQWRPWEEARGVATIGRVFEYTDADIRGLFSQNDEPHFAEMIKHPCLFMREGTDDERSARVGTINRARVAGGEVVLEYVFDPDVPPIPNSTIHANRLDFDMPQEFEFNRTHWAIKDVDLYRVVHRHIRPRRQRPTVFEIGEHERIEPELASAMMPFDAAFDLVWRAIRSGAQDAGLRCRRADDIWENAAIIQDIVSLIDRSRVVICDCTGRNPNVFYEAGIAHTLGRDVVLITQNPDDIPFDLRHLRYIRYLNNAQGRRALRTALRERLETLIGAGLGEP